MSFDFIKNKNSLHRYDRNIFKDSYSNLSTGQFHSTLDLIYDVSRESSRLASVFLTETRWMSVVRTISLLSARRIVTRISPSVLPLFIVSKPCTSWRSMKLVLCFWDIFGCCFLSISQYLRRDIIKCVLLRRSGTVCHCCRNVLMVEYSLGVVDGSVFAGIHRLRDLRKVTARS